MLRCWDYQRMQHLQVDVAHNDWINTLETDYDHKELYSGSKDGIIKVWRMKNQKMKCMANLNGSLSGLSINTLSKIDKQFGRMFASGSSDKCLKIWKRKGQDLDQSSPEQFDNEMDDPFDKAIDRNQDFFQDDEGGMDMKFVNQVNKYEEVKNIPP